MTALDNGFLRERAGESCSDSIHNISSMLYCFFFCCANALQNGFGVFGLPFQYTSFYRVVEQTVLADQHLRGRWGIELT